MEFILAYGFDSIAPGVGPDSLGKSLITERTLFASDRLRALFGVGNR